MTKQGWITRKLNGNGTPWNKGVKGLQVAWNKGIKTSKEIREKQSMARKGKYVGEKSASWKGGKPNCTDCGEKLSSYKYGYCGKCIHNHQQGVGASNWQGGLTKKNNIRMSIEYKLWRKFVFERDGFACIWCGFQSRGTRPADIHADHIKSFALFPELRLTIDNGRTLCVACHKTTETFGNRPKNYAIISNAA